jgi:hypothetical protein
MVRGKRWFLLAAGTALTAWACSSGSSSDPNPKALTPGDHLYVDVDASSPPMQQEDPDAANDPIFARVDSGVAYTNYDAGIVLTVCAPPEAGAGDAGPAKSGNGGGEDGGGGDGGAYAPAAACTPIPAACTSKPTCDCLIPALSASIPCPYPHCSLLDGFNIYCP